MQTVWRVELLGCLQATRGERIITHFRTQKTAALLAYLAYHRDRPHSRNVLMELFWPDSGLEAARHSLSVAFSSLRRQFEPDDVLRADNSTAQLNAAAITTDVSDFAAALQDAEHALDAAGRVSCLGRAIQIYRGELLPGYFDDWILQERQWLSERFFRGLTQLLADLEGQGDLARALTFGQRGIALDPLREEAHRHLIRLYLAAGQPDAALRQYQELERLLQRELDTLPDETTRALLAAIEEEGKRESEGTRERANDGDDLAPRVRSLVPSFSRSLATTQKIALLYKRHAQPDERVLRVLETALREQGYQVFVDRHLAVGVEWAREIERQVCGADAVIPLLSAAALPSEMLAYEIQTAHEAAQIRGGRPRLLPVRVNYTGPLPEPLAAILDPLEYALWQEPRDDARLVEQLLEVLAKSAEQRSNGATEKRGSAEQVSVSPPPRLPASPSPRTHAFPGGVVPLDSPFYVARSCDGELRSALERRDSIIRMKGARQMGKTSLLARGLQYTREAGARVVLTDFQVLDVADLQSVERLFPALGSWIADQLDLEVFPKDVWKDHLGPSVNFERYLRREVLDRLDSPLVWGLDEVDRLFRHDCGSQLFSLVRSWHNRRGLDPTGPWGRLTIALAYATEAHLFITDPNQSPFNVGSRISLADFDREQVGDLNDRYGAPLRDLVEVTRFHQLVGGQPYLANRGLWELATRGLTLEAFTAEASRDEGAFGDHLRRLLALLVRDGETCDAVRDVLRGAGCPTDESFYRLRSAGVLSGETAREAQPRCPLYGTYLERHLL